MTTIEATRPVALASPSPGVSSDYVTVPEAAIALGVTVETVRRRLRAGTVDGIRVATSTGREWRVRLADCEADGADAEAAMPAKTVPQVRDCEAHIADLRAHVARLEALLSARDAEAAMRAAEHGRLVEALASLSTSRLVPPRPWWRLW